jgi:hypothetical protein
VLVFDAIAPAAAIAALLIIGVMLEWPLWWVSVCSILCLLIVEAVFINIVGYRRDSVTVGTDDDKPVLRLVVMAIAASAVATAAAVGYNTWTATEVAEASATFNPADPNSSVDRAASLMLPERAEAFKTQFGSAAADMAKRNVSAQANTVSAGLEALGESSASVAVLIRGTQSAPGEQPSTTVLALRVVLAKQDGGWRVVDVAPINAR